MGLGEFGSQSLFAARPVVSADQMEDGGERAEQQQDEQDQSGEVLFARRIGADHRQGDGGGPGARGNENGAERHAEFRQPPQTLAARPEVAATLRQALWLRLAFRPVCPAQAMAPSDRGRRA